MIKYTVCDMCGKKYRRKMDMLQHKKDDHLFITKEEVAALERLKETVRPNLFLGYNIKFTCWTLCNSFYTTRKAPRKRQ